LFLKYYTFFDLPTLNKLFKYDASVTTQNLEPAQVWK